GSHFRHSALLCQRVPTRAYAPHPELFALLRVPNYLRRQVTARDLKSLDCVRKDVRLPIASERLVTSPLPRPSEAFLCRCKHLGSAAARCAASFLCASADRLQLEPDAY